MLRVSLDEESSEYNEGASGSTGRRSVNEKLAKKLPEEGPPHPVYELSDKELAFLRMKAISVGNFAVLCMRRMFTVEERTAANTCISGKRRKIRLDITGERLNKIYQYVLKGFAIPENGTQNAIKQCNMCMDQANRNFRLYLERSVDLP